MKKALLLLFLILNVILVLAQIGPYKPLDKYSFIRYEADTLVFDSDSSLLSVFFEKLDRFIETREGEINILQIGGSHIQAGTMSNTIRRNILFSDTTLTRSRGFVFPYSLGSKSNNPSDYRVSKNGKYTLVRNVYKEHARPLGTSGVAAFTTDSLSDFTIIFRDSLFRYDTKRVILVGEVSSRRNVPSIWVDSIEYYPTAVDTILGRYVYDVAFREQFTVATNCDGTPEDEFVIHGLFLEDEHRGIAFHSVGVNGASVPSYLRCQNYGQELDLFRPDLVIFGIGINDAFDSDFTKESFEQNYLMLIDEIKSYNPDCAFIFFTNNDSYKRVRKKFYNNKNAVAVQKVMYSLAQQTRGGVFDQYKIMGGSTSMYKWYVNKLAKYDRVHFTSEGYQLMGDLFYNAFIHAQMKCRDTRERQLIIEE